MADLRGLAPKLGSTPLFVRVTLRAPATNGGTCTVHWHGMVTRTGDYLKGERRAMVRGKDSLLVLHAHVSDVLGVDGQNPRTEAWEPLPLDQVLPR